MAGVERVVRAGVVRPLGDLRADAGDAGVLDSVLGAASGVMPALNLSLRSVLLRPAKTSLNSGSLRIFAHAPVFYVVEREVFFGFCGFAAYKGVDMNFRQLVMMTVLHAFNDDMVR